MLNLLDVSVRESISGLISEYRAYFRTVQGFQGTTQQVPVSLAKLQERVQSRLDGLRPDIDSHRLTIALLRQSLKAIGLRTTGDSIVLDVVVPTPRSAHAR